MAMKNLYGPLGGQRNCLHQGINHAIADLASATDRHSLSWMQLECSRETVRPAEPLDISMENTIVAGVDMVAIELMG